MSAFRGQPGWVGQLIARMEQALADISKLRDNAGRLRGTPDTVIGIFPSEASSVGYTPAVLTDWDIDADPGNLDDALDQLAERVDDSEVVIIDHINDPVDAHDAWAISFAPGSLSAITVQAAIDELNADYLAADVAHLTDAIAAHAASAISTAFPLIDANVQASLESFANDLGDHIDDTAGAHAASAVSVADAGGYFTAIEVEAALQEIMADGHELTLTVENPTAAENIVMRQFTQAVTIAVIQVIVIGGTSVTIDFEHGSTITTATKLLSAPEVVASANTTGEHIGGTGTAMVATFNDVTLAAGDFLRLKTIAIVGVPTQLSVTLKFRLK